MRARHRLRLGWIVLLGLLAGAAGAVIVLAYAEERLYFRDPYSGETTDEEISTIHDDLTYALALAAGFSEKDAITLQIWNQLVDSEQLGPGDVISYTNCAGSFYPTPSPRDRAVCPSPGNYSTVAWPLWERMQDAETCATSRFGPYEPFFHFPHQNAAELGALRDWGWGITDTLRGYEAYAWGGLTVVQATCRYTRTAVIAAGIPAGSLQAFATYLHSLADSYSHRECIAEMDRLGLPWATHTTPPLDPSIYACDYHPSAPNNTDAHGREFGVGAMSDSLRTDEAIRAVYAELAARSRLREGVYWPLSLDTPLTAIADSPTLSETLYAFVHDWDWDQPYQRRQWAGQISAAIRAQRSATWRYYAPFIPQVYPSPTPTPVASATPAAGIAARLSVFSSRR